MIFDSNLIIYSAQPNHAELRRLVAEAQPAISIVSVVEVLGYHRLADEDRQHFDRFFRAARILRISDPVVDKAVQLRQRRRMSLGDSLIAATAIVHDQELYTHNVADYQDIEELIVIDPLSDENQQ